MANGAELCLLFLFALKLMTYHSNVRGCHLNKKARIDCVTSYVLLRRSLFFFKSATCLKQSLLRTYTCKIDRGCVVHSVEKAHHEDRKHVIVFVLLFISTGRTSGSKDYSPGLAIARSLSKYLNYTDEIRSSQISIC